MNIESTYTTRFTYHAADQQAHLAGQYVLHKLAAKTNVGLDLTNAPLPDGADPCSRHMTGVATATDKQDLEVFTARVQDMLHWIDVEVR